MKTRIGLITALLAFCITLTASAQNNGKKPTFRVACNVLAADITLTAHMPEGDKTVAIGYKTVPLRTGMRYTLSIVKEGYTPYRKSFTCNWKGLKERKVVLEKGVGPIPKKDWEVDLEDNVKMEFVPIPTGSFMMGSEDGDEDEQPMRKVSFSRPFWMAKTEVTEKQYEQFRAEAPKVVREKGVLMPSGAELPVIGVSWADAMAFCKWLTQKERKHGRLPDGYEFTLPTEAEWEYACRAGSTGDYAGKLDSMGWFKKNISEKTSPVGLKNPNDWGLYDMHGNVWEWCADYWYVNYDNAPTDGSQRGLAYNEYHAPTELWGETGNIIRYRNTSFRTIRGGGWFSPASACRSANRQYERPGEKTNYLGFRPILIWNPPTPSMEVTRRIPTAQ